LPPEMASYSILNLSTGALRSTGAHLNRLFGLILFVLSFWKKRSALSVFLFFLLQGPRDGSHP